MLAGMVKAPTAFNPTTASGYPQALRPAQLRHPRHGRDRRHHPGRRPTDGQGRQARARRSSAVGNGCVSVAEEQLGLLLRLLLPLVDEPGGVRRDHVRPGAAAEERRLPDRHRRSTSRRRTRPASSIAEQIDGQEQERAAAGRVEPGTGKVRALAANRKYKLDDPADPQNKISSDPKKARKGIRGTYPNTTNPLLTGGGDITGYQAGSVFKMFTMVAALEKGYPLGYTINAEKRVQVGLHRRVRQRRRLPRHPLLLPEQRRRRRGRRLQHVDRLRQLGQHVLRPARGAGRRRERGRRGQAVRHPVPRQRATPSSPTTRTRAHQWGAFTLGVSATTPLDMANAYATLAADGMYCEPTPVEQITDQDGEKLDVGKPHCNRATTKDVARAALDAARCPVGDSAQLGSCDGADRPATSAASSGTRSSARPAPPTHDKTAALIAGTTSLVVAGYPGQPRLSRPPRPDGARRSSTRRSTNTLARLHEGQAEGPVQEARQQQDRRTATSARSRTSTCDVGRRRRDPAGGRRLRGRRRPAARSTRPARPAPRPAPTRTAAPSRAASSCIQVSNGKGDDEAGRPGQAR